MFVIGKHLIVSSVIQFIMNKEYIIYISLALFVIFSFLRTIPFSNILATGAIIFAIFRAEEFKKEDQSRGNKLIWASIAIFLIVVLIQFIPSLLLS